VGRHLQFEREARAWASRTGASVWLEDHGGAFVVRLDNPPSGFASVYKPEAFFAKIGGKITPRQTSPRPLKFTIKDYRNANKAYGANCGYGALAAILGITIDKVRALAPESEEVGGIYRHLMPSVIRRAGWECRDIGARLPEYGLAVVVFDDDMKQGHWIAVAGNKFFDSYSISEGLDWCDASKWWSKIAPKVATYWPKTSKEWRIDLGLEVER
jgi:hypothetical protein